MGVAGAGTGDGGVTCAERELLASKPSETAAPDLRRKSRRFMSAEATRRPGPAPAISQETL